MSWRNNKYGINKLLFKKCMYNYNYINDIAKVLIL